MLIRNKAISVESVGQELILIDETNRRVFILNQTLSLIWQLLENNDKFESIEASVAGQYSRMDENRVKKIVEKSIQMLIQQSLVSEVPSV